MFTTILVPLDGSIRAEAALPVAACIARRTGATLVLVRVISVVTEAWPAILTSNPLLAEAVVETDLTEVTEYLERIAASPELAGIPTKMIIQHGPPAPTLLNVIDLSQSDLIVLCRHGASGMARWMMGSVAEKIALYASVPVFIVHEDGSHKGRSLSAIAQPLRMLVPLDGSTFAQAALEPGAALLTALAAPGQRVALHLASVIKPSSTDILRAKGMLNQTASQLQEGSLVSIIAQQHIPVTWSVLQETDVASALLRVAERGEDTEGAGVFGGCDLIALSTHGRGGFQRWVIGSVAQRVLATTTRPILLVHPTKATRP